MEKPLAVHIGQCLESLIGDVPHLLVRQPALLLLELVDVAIEVLEDEEELIVLLDEFEQLHDIGVMQFGEDAYLVEVDALGPVLVVPLHSLDGHHLPRLLVQALVHAPETAVPQLVPHLVLLHLNCDMIINQPISSSPGPSSITSWAGWFIIFDQIAVVWTRPSLSSISTPTAATITTNAQPTVPSNPPPSPPNKPALLLPRRSPTPSSRKNTRSCTRPTARRWKR